MGFFSNCGFIFIFFTRGGGGVVCQCIPESFGRHVQPSAEVIIERFVSVKGGEEDSQADSDGGVQGFENKMEQARLFSDSHFERARMLTRPQHACNFEQIWV